MESIITIVVCLTFYYGLRWLERNGPFTMTKLRDMDNKDIDDFVKSMMNFLKETQGISKTPKYRFGDLSKQESAYEVERVYGIYDYNLKLIVLDVAGLKEFGASIKDLTYLFSHEWQHYIDHLNGITYDTVGVEMCESRAVKFGKKYSREICKNIELT